MNRQQFNAMVAQYGEIGMGALYGDSLDWSGGAHCNLPSLVFNGECKQYGTPTPDNPVPIYSFDGLAYVRRGDSYSYLYTPYLNGIGDYKDEWDYVSGKGLRYIHKIELDGETKKITVANSNGASILLEHPVGAGGHNGVISTHFKPQWNTNHGSIYASNNTTIRLCRDLSDVAASDRVNAWNTWLSEQYANGTPVTVYYAMAEPIPFEERNEYDVYEPIPNDSGHIDTVDSSIQPPFRITYITHS